MSKVKTCSVKAFVVRQFVLSARPRAGGGFKYHSDGLKCRMIRPGVFRIRRKDGLNIKGSDVAHVLAKGPEATRWVASLWFGDDRFFTVFLRRYPIIVPTRRKDCARLLFDVFFISRVRD